MKVRVGHLKLKRTVDAEHRQPNLNRNLRIFNIELFSRTLSIFFTFSQQFFLSLNEVLTVKPLFFLVKKCLVCTALDDISN